MVPRLTCTVTHDPQVSMYTVTHGPRARSFGRFRNGIWNLVKLVQFHRSISLEFVACQSAKCLYSVWVQNPAQLFITDRPFHKPRQTIAVPIDNVPVYVYVCVWMVCASALFFFFFYRFAPVLCKSCQSLLLCLNNAVSFITILTKDQKGENCSSRDVAEWLRWPVSL